MAKTRAAKPSAKSNADDAPETAKSTSQRRQLGPESSNPPKVFVLPKNTTSEARIVTLQNPRYQTNSRYLICPERGIYEFTKIAAPKSVPRSWLLSTQDAKQDEEEIVKAEDVKIPITGASTEDVSKGFVLKSAEMLIATPIDPLFLLLPALYPIPSTKGTESEKKLFLSGEDYIDRVTDVSPHLKPMLRSASTRKLLESRMAVVCDTVDVGDETMYRINHTKLIHAIWQKAEVMVAKGLPESIEEKFIRKALEVPMLCLQRDDSYHDSLRKAEEESELANSSTPNTETGDSQTSSSTIATISTAATSFTSESGGNKADTPSQTQESKPQIQLITAPDGIRHLLRLRTAFNYILSRYIPSYLHTPLNDLLLTTSSSSPTLTPTPKLTTSSPTPLSIPSIPSLTPLTTHLTHLHTLRKQALAARALTNDLSHKRRLEDDELVAEAEERAEKRRKKEEEEKRKRASETRGVKNLKKVNVSGMKKMSDFFKKK